MEDLDRYLIDPEYKAEPLALYCLFHRDLRWNTKNIDSIGARRIYWFPDWNPEGARECSCSINALRVVPHEHRMRELAEGKNIPVEADKSGN